MIKGMIVTIAVVVPGKGDVPAEIDLTPRVRGFHTDAAQMIRVSVPHDGSGAESKGGEERALCKGCEERGRGPGRGRG